MPPSGSSTDDLSPERGPFPTTNWTVIRCIQEGTAEQAKAALERFCRTYWYPVYACCRHSGYSIEAAEDLTQTFFQQLIAQDSIRRITPEKGRLRFYVRGALKNLISNQRRHDAAAKRNPGTPVLSFSLKGAEDCYLREPEVILDPDRLFDRAWACRVMTAAEEALKGEFEKEHSLAHFEILRDFLPNKNSALSQSEAAERLGIPDGVFRLHLHRTRKRFGILVENEIAQTVSEPGAIREEVAYLVDLLSV
jgi:RNA polymerase sigma-70 factor (ECF subfamily)